MAQGCLERADATQLDARYAHDWHAEGRGVYIVLWFGNVAGKNLPAHPDGLAAPASPDALPAMLVDRVPERRRAQIDVYVINVTGIRWAAQIAQKGSKPANQKPTRAARGAAAKPRAPAARGAGGKKGKR